MLMILSGPNAYLLALLLDKAISGSTTNTL